ncbi:MAG: hypothetical protein ACLQNE_43875 [Thermoguttaceae bacterium]
MSGRVQNTSSVPLDARLDVLSGIDTASLAPRQLKLAPAEAADVILSGVPTGEKIVLGKQTFSTIFDIADFIAAGNKKMTAAAKTNKPAR